MTKRKISVRQVCPRVVLFPLLFAAVLSVAAESPGKDNETCDLIYLGSEGPLAIRLHIDISGKSSQNVWNAYLDKLFGDMDKDQNGELAGSELQEIPARRELAQAGLLDGMPFQGVASADTSPRDGKVVKKELTNYFRRQGVRPLSARLVQQASNQFALPQQQRSSDSPLFDRLDVNRDGKLTKAEAAAVHQRLYKLDLDEDGTIDVIEVSPAPTLPEEFVFNPPSARQPLTLPFLSTAANVSSSRLINLFVTTYDQATAETSGDRNGPLGDARLDVDELGETANELLRFDADSDRALDFIELSQFVRSPEPHVEIAVRLGDTKANDDCVALIKTNSNSRVTLLPSGDRSAELLVGDTRIEIVAQSSDQTPDAKSYMESLFLPADRDANGYLDEDEVAANTFLNGSFELIDSNRNGQVVKAEFLAYMEKLIALARSHTTVVVEGQGRALFGALDGNSDGRLAHKELEDLGRRVATWDRDGNDEISRQEIPQQYRISVDQNLLGGNTRIRLAADGLVSSSGQLTSGPIWFQRMDRNRDGMVSANEFLGPRTDFTRLDVDKSGSLNASEASTE